MSVHLKGLSKIFAGGIGFAIIFSTVLANGLGDPSHGGPFKLIAMGVPGALALVGCIEFFTGIEFGEVSEKWDGLQGWQRGALGLLVVFLALVLLFGGLAIFG